MFRPPWLNNSTAVGPLKKTFSEVSVLTGTFSDGGDPVQRLVSVPSTSIESHVVKVDVPKKEL